MSEYRLINVRIDTFRYDDFFSNVSFDEVIDKIQKLKSDLESTGFSDMQFQIAYCYESTEVALYGNRLETDQELATRLKAEEKARITQQKLDAKKAAEELKLYKQLKKKFGDI